MYYSLSRRCGRKCAHLTIIRSLKYIHTTALLIKAICAHLLPQGNRRRKCAHLTGIRSLKYIHTTALLIKAICAHLLPQGNRRRKCAHLTGIWSLKYKHMATLLTTAACTHLFPQKEENKEESAYIFRTVRKKTNQSDWRLRWITRNWQSFYFRI